jgi:hypothetical protein
MRKNDTTRSKKLIMGKVSFHPVDLLANPLKVIRIIETATTRDGVFMIQTGIKPRLQVLARIGTFAILLLKYVNYQLCVLSRPGSFFSYALKPTGQALDFRDSYAAHFTAHAKASLFPFYSKLLLRSLAGVTTNRAMPSSDTGYSMTIDTKTNSRMARDSCFCISGYYFTGRQVVFSFLSIAAFLKARIIKFSTNIKRLLKIRYQLSARFQLVFIGTH